MYLKQKILEKDIWSCAAKTSYVPLQLWCRFYFKCLVVIPSASWFTGVWMVVDWDLRCHKVVDVLPPENVSEEAKIWQVVINLSNGLWLEGNHPDNRKK